MHMNSPFHQKNLKKYRKISDVEHHSSLKKTHTHTQRERERERQH